MNPPAYEFLSAPPWILALLNVLTLTLHLAAMGALFGGLGILLGVRLPGKWSRPAVRRLVRLAPTLVAVTVTLGVAPLLFVQLVYHRQVYAAAIVSAWYWLAVVGLVIAAYFLLYARAFADRRPAPRGALRIAIAFALLLPVSMVLSSVFTLAETPRMIANAYAAASTGWALNPDLGRWLPRWLHLLAGALALGAFYVTASAHDDVELRHAARTAYLWTMAAAMLLGFGALAGLGEGLLPYLSSPAAWWMAGSLLLALASLHLIYRDRILGSGILLALSLAGMVEQRHLARLLALRGTLDPATMTIRPQWSVFALFLICFVAMAATVGWMLVLFFRRPKIPTAG